MSLLRRLVLPFLLAPALFAQVPASELNASRAFEKARAAGPLAVEAFVAKMPKGGDLHMHLSGAIYAETFLKDAVDDHLCVDPAKLTLVKPVAAGSCPEGDLPASTAFKDQRLYDELVDGFSMRAFVPTPGINGHDQFFATFSRFGALGKEHGGEWLDEVATRAAAQNEQYLEIMNTPSFGKAASLGYSLGWPGDSKPVTTAATSAGDNLAGTSRSELAALRDKLLAGGLRDEAAEDSREFADALAARKQLEHCGTPEALPACSVEIRFLFQVLRAFPPQQVFAQTLLGFEVAAHDPNVVGINFVQPEDAYMAMSEYHRQMLMLDYLHTVYPQVHISLHAGEVAPGLVPPAGLKFHIRQAVELGHAERIGHGVDVMHESDPQALLKELAAKHVMIEINLTSNDVILGVTGKAHPLPSYLAAHVPVAFSTDDEGVSRIDLTHEYTRAALDFGLKYPDLKRSARTSIEHSFLPGKSLWAQEDAFTRVVPACAGQPIGAEHPAATCEQYLRANRKAAQEWELERRFHTFEKDKE
jgi:adenosine deaminase